MGITYRVDHEKRIIFVVWDGVVTAEDWFRNIERLIADPAWPSISSILADLRTVTTMSSIEEAEIEHAITLFKTDPFSLFRKKVGIVASEVFAKSLQFAELISRFGPTVIVFNDMQTACLYLDVNIEEALKVLQELRLRLRADLR